MHHRTNVVTDKRCNPYSGSSLVPMLAAGLVLAGMILALALS